MKIIATIEGPGTYSAGSLASGDQDLWRKSVLEVLCKLVGSLVRRDFLVLLDNSLVKLTSVF